MKQFATLLMAAMLIGGSSLYGQNTGTCPRGNECKKGQGQGQGCGKGCGKGMRNGQCPRGVTQTPPPAQK